MRFKLGENLGLLGKTLLEAEGHDVMTVVEQRLSGAKDASIYKACRESSSSEPRRDHHPRAVAVAVLRCPQSEPIIFGCAHVLPSRLAIHASFSASV
jgi:hypothetical protein